MRKQWCKAKSLVCQNEPFWYDDYDFDRLMPKPVHFVQLVTRNYIKKGFPSLASAAHLHSAEKHLVCYKFEPTDFLRQRLPHFDLVHLPATPFESFNMVQGGQFLDAFPPMANDEIVILADADVMIQRDFTQEELARFAKYDFGTMGLGPNARPTDNLWEEAQRIGMEPHSTYSAMACYNCGVIVGRVAAWRRLRQDFERDALDWYAKSQNRSRIQWALCHSLHRLNVKIDTLPHTIHTHGHFELPKGVEDGKYNGETIVFRHRF